MIVFVFIALFLVALSFGLKSKANAAFVTLLIVGACYFGYVGLDCYRLERAEIGTEPFICIGNEMNDNQVTYYGLGYSVSYYLNSPNEFYKDVMSIDVACYGAEFRMFDSILIWGWVE